MSDYRELVAILKELLTNRFYPKPQFIRALLGDGQGNVIVPDRPDYNYVRFNRSSSEKFEVFNKEVSQPIDGWPILVGELPWQPGLTQVVGTDWAAYSQTGWGDSVASIQAHAPTHEWPTFAPGSDAVNVYMRALTPLRTQVVGSGSNSVYVTPYEYDHTGTNVQWPGVPAMDFSSKPPTGSMLYMGVYLNPATNALGVVSGSTTVFTDALEPTIPNWPLGVYPSGYVRLYGGQAGITERDIRPAQRIYNSTLMFTGTSGGGGGASAASQSEVDAGTEAAKYVAPLTLRNTPTGLLKVKNTSGFTAATGWMGYLVHTASSGIEFKSTVVSASDYASACAVVTGGADGTNIWVSTRGRHPLLYSSTAPSAGDYLILSGIGAVVRQTYMSPDVVAIAQAAGAGSVVDALLLTGTQWIQMASSTRLYAVVAHSTTAFTATINGAPSTTSVVYNAPSAGNEDNLPPSGTLLGNLVIFNTTRGTARLLTACNTGTNTITTVATTDSWASGDTITIISPTVGNGMAEIDLSQATALAAIPALARSILIAYYKLDSGGAGNSSYLHPIGTFSASAVVPNYSQNATGYSVSPLPVGLVNRRFSYHSNASGAGTTQDLMDLIGFYLAVP